MLKDIRNISSKEIGHQYIMENIKDILIFLIVRYSVEVADFDFGASEEPEYKTMYEQIKESLSQAVSGQDWDADEDNKWRDRGHVVERPRVRDYGTVPR